MNKTFHTGNLVADPESRFSQNGKAIGNFRLAVSGRNDKTLYFDVTCFDKTAENVCKFKKKGDPVLVEGRLEVDEWEDKETKKKRSKIYIVAENVEFLSGGKSQSENGPKPPPANKKTTTPQEVADDNDVPF